MSSAVNVGNGKYVRPSWNHSRPAGEAWPGMENAQLEMLESIRNVLEDVKGSQMLQCDVAGAIKRMESEARQARLILARIDRRLAKVEKLR